MIVLAEKGLWKGIPNKLLEWSKMEHKAEDVLKLNPRGQVSMVFKVREDVQCSFRSTLEVSNRPVAVFLSN